MLTVTCGRCGIEFEPERADVVRGVWRICPSCRGSPPVSRVDIPEPVRPPTDRESNTLVPTQPHTRFEHERNDQ